VHYREAVGREKRRAFREETYWACPVPGFGDPRARIVVVGLAPAAHGGNRTGRIFTGDRSGEWLYRALYRAGLANQPESVSRDDGLELRGVYVCAAARCAPPENKPTPQELTDCRPFLVEELKLLRHNAAPCPPLAVVALGAVAMRASLAAIGVLHGPVSSPLPRFRHLAEYRLHDDVVLLCSYHPSQRNTQTGLLTQSMFDAVFFRARELVCKPAQR
jgi:uracil-DNA glycosylase family 4